MKTKKSKWFWMWVGVGALVLLGIVLRPTTVLVDGAAATRGPLQVTVDEEGKTRIRERYVVAAPLAGRLQRVALKAGDAVEAGTTVLATIDAVDPVLLDPRTEAEAEARVKAAAAIQEQTVPNLEAARARHELARKELDRANELLNDNVISQQEMDRAVATERSAAEELKAARFAEKIAAFELEQAQAALLRSRPGTADDSDESQWVIRAPVSGRVLRVLQESSVVVQSGTPLIELGDPADLEVEVDVLSADAMQIEPGAKVYLERWGGPQPLMGRVRLVEPAGFTKVSALGVEEQRVWILVDFDTPPAPSRPLGDAYRVEARIVTWESDSVLKVPAGALFRSGGAWAVFVLEKGKARLRKLQIGHNNGLEVEVLDGLTEGDSVIVHPGDQIRDGISAKARTE
ncbi:MAG: efflux RND transporter periplasmic adaptor subunit [Kiritimatiellae bacterium]|nr:efflux RND transporter periplasmic adaptor subunit [Kiritimatiellia bacterium]